MTKTINSGVKEIHEKYDFAEWDRIRKHFAKKQNQQIDKRLKNKFSIHLDFPDGSKVVSLRKNFCRIELPPASRPIEFVGEGKQDVGTILSGIMIYQYPFTDSSWGPR